MRILPEGFGWKVLAAMAAAVAGNILVQYVIPWPDFMKASYGAAAEILGDYPVGVYLLLTLLIAPLVEEGIFRRGIYAVFRRWLGVTPAAFLSALAFGLGLLLAWGYESSSFGKYRMVVLMHGAANGAAVLCSMVFSGLF